MNRDMALGVWKEGDEGEPKIDEIEQLFINLINLPTIATYISSCIDQWRVKRSFRFSH